MSPTPPSNANDQTAHAQTAYPQRPASAPDFLLSRAAGSVRTQGSTATFTDARAAQEALNRGNAELIVGALPFDATKPAALTAPASIIREPGTLHPHPYYREGPGAELSATLTGVDPQPEEHLRRVAEAVRAISEAHTEAAHLKATHAEATHAEATQTPAPATTPLGKVVLARAVDIAFDPPVDPRLVAARLIELSASRDGFIADLSPAGPNYRGHFLVGSSPEVLVKRLGTTVTSYPLAGSAARIHNDPAADKAAGQKLAASAKDLDEHRFVVDHIRELLAPLCTHLDIPDRPILERTNEMWHLATPIVGTLREPAPSALELACLLYPTPAVCGTPPGKAFSLIDATETDRGFYAGAVGYCDAAGDGEYMVAIRCAEVNGDGTAARAWAGGGLTADSDPQAELDETTAKLRTILGALGL
ncbi:isochorismate synthase MenF [Corynebacterium sp. CNCTC7651]|uniref:isochorismate synthase n=1 Tax=Corynebacterium sp. CNCTC7651 TaxID=2815361 RepID=UPI00351D43D2